MNLRNKKIIISLFVIVFAILGLVGYKAFVNSKQIQGQKEYTLVVRDVNNTFKDEFNFNTEEGSLGKDLDNRELIETDNSGTSRFVIGVNGKDADASKQEWWNLKINGEDSQTGIDDTSINDGDKIEFILTTGW